MHSDFKLFYNFIYIEGYTSISVREPLANILAQTKATYQQNQPTRLPVDPHYATVSDDSGILKIYLSLNSPC